MLSDSQYGKPYRSRNSLCQDINSFINENKKEICINLREPSIFGSRCYDTVSIELIIAIICRYPVVS